MREIDNEEFEKKGKKEKIDPEEIERLDEFFRQLSGDYQVSIYREEPREYKGFLETFQVDDLDNPISIGYLIKEWGGKVLRIMVRNPSGKFQRRAVIPLRSYDPLVRGVPCDRRSITGVDAQVRDGSKDYLEMLKTVQSTIKDLSPSPKNGESSTQMMMQMMLPFFTAIAQNMTRPPSGQPSMAEMMNMMVKMKQFVGDGSIGDTGGGEGDMMASVLKIGEALVQQRGAAVSPPVQLPSRLTAPRVATIPREPHVYPPVSNPSPAPMQSPSSLSIPGIEDGKISVESIPDLITQMPAELTTQLFLESLAKMDQNKAEELLSGIFKAVGVEEYDEPVTDTETGADENVQSQSAGGAADRPNARDSAGGRSRNKKRR